MAELVRARAAVTAEIVLSGDPRVLPSRYGSPRRDRVVVDADIVWIEAHPGEGEARAPGRSSAPRDEPRGGGVRVRVPVVVFGDGSGWVGLGPGER
ncbi:hypothetical protein, partial [Sphaerisporangium aureirubrum]